MGQPTVSVRRLRFPWLRRTRKYTGGTLQLHEKLWETAGPGYGSEGTTYRRIRQSSWHWRGPCLCPDPIFFRERSIMRLRLGALPLSFGLMLVLSMTPASGDSSWPMTGHDPANTAFNSDERTLNSRNVGHLRHAWTYSHQLSGV